MALTDGQILSILQSLDTEAEKQRKFKADQRHEIFLDGGKKYVIEALKREFDEDAVDELRVVPINFLKKIVKIKSGNYSQPPQRLAKTNLESDQKLIEYYEQELDFNSMMFKANVYLNLHSNTALYFVPNDKEFINFMVLPPQMYSIVPNALDPSQVDIWVIGKFLEPDLRLDDDAMAATGVEGWSRERESRNLGPGQVASQAKAVTDKRRLIWWTPEEHFTTNQRGTKIVLDPNKGMEQFGNPIGENPLVHLQMPNDGEPWSRQGSDMVDLQMALALGWTDIMSIGKIQGFSVMSVVSPEKPTKMKIGLNKILWLKQIEGQPTPSVSYLQASSPLSEYKELLGDLLGLLLSTNDISPGTIGGKMSGNIQSGFQAMIEQSDAIRVMLSQQPILRNAEVEAWQKIAKIHNWMRSVGVLKEEAAALGDFSKDFDVQVIFRELKPLESEQERINSVRELSNLKLLSREDAMKRLHPDMTEEQIKKKLKEIDKQVDERAKKAMEVFDAKTQGKEEEGSKEKSDKEKEKESKEEIERLNGKT